MSNRSVLRIAAALLSLVASVPAQQLAVGDPAPPIVVTSWSNWEGPPPSLDTLKGRVVMLEFWGTWCGPCVRAMPGIQKLHDRYAERGLTVLAISYEEPAVMAPFLVQNAYTMPVGSDPQKQTIGAYGIRGWPTTVVVDKEGKVAHIGSPYDAEAAVEKALGLEAGPGVLLVSWLDSLGKPKAEQRGALDRLLEKGPADFDLQAWARGQVPTATVVPDGAPPAAAPASPAPAGIADADGALRRCAEAWKGDPALRTRLLQQLADTGPIRFDLGAFARDAMRRAFPFEVTEMKTLLKEKKYAAVVEAVAQRAPAASVLAAAAKDSGLSSFCKAKVEEARTMAKKGLMAQLWVFPGALPRDEKTNAAFFSELAVSGMATSPDKKSITGVMLGAEVVEQTAVATFVQSQLAAALVMTDLAAGKSPRVQDLDKLVQRQRAAITKDLESRYGKPEPRKVQ